jgi:hypothetical protein
VSGSARLPIRGIPLSIAPGRFWLWGVALSVIAAVSFVGSAPGNFVDFPQFWAAGRTVGTPDLVDLARHQDWQLAHGLPAGFFAYPPGTAWLFAPFAQLPLAAAFWIQAALMSCLVFAAGLVGARTFGLDRRVAVIAALAWTPCLGSAAMGQNTALALLLALVTIEGFRREDDVLAGVATGLLLYKPTLALPLIGVMILKRRWVALGLVSGFAAGWYVAGILAAAGDLWWPGHWLSGLGEYYTTDTLGNVNKTISIPGLLVGHGAAQWIGLALGAALVTIALPRLMRASIVEAGVGACLIGLVASPHSLNYEATLMLPAILWAVRSNGLREPLRTRLACAAYLVAPTYLLSPTLGFSPLAILVIGCAAIWLLDIGRADASAGLTSCVRSSYAAN